jgi:hyperosmotically inducible periplasmic protein
MKRIGSLLFAGLLAAGLALTGCADKDKDAVPDRTEDAGRAAGTAAGNAGEAAKDAASGTVDATQNAALTAKVKTAFGTDTTVPAMSINVDTSGDGVVTLTGEVPSEAAKARAEELAKGTEGVKSVVNNLTVKSGG